MGVNRVILLGNLGRDPELRYTSNQFPVCNFSLATGERRKDPQGNWVDHTEWHNIVALGRTAENCGNYLKKGRQVFVEGSIRTRKWQDKEGKDRYTTEVVANRIEFIGSRSDSGASTGGSYQSQPQAQAANDVLSSLGSADDVASSGGDDVAFDDDDIPF